MRSYERNMGYKCDVCNFETSSVKILNIHKRSEHINAIKSNMKCDMCEFGASSRIDLERHNKSYHKCANCEFKTEKQTDLLKHKKNAHKIKCFTCSFEAGTKEEVKNIAMGGMRARYISATNATILLSTKES